jgi:hypothetical protein
MPEISRNRQNARYAEDVVNVKDFGAVGDGVTDDNQAISDAIAYAESVNGSVYFPAGTYLYSGNYTVSDTMEIRGAGSRLTLFKPTAGQAGWFLTIDDCWRQSSSTGGEKLVIDNGTYDFDVVKSGVKLRGFTVVGDRDNASQSGIRTNDRCDQMTWYDVEVHQLTGTGISLGNAGTLPLVRESAFYDIVVRGCGGSSVEPFIINTGSGAGDATNNLRFYNLSLVYNYSASILRGDNSTHETRRLRFFGFMLHGTGSGTPYGNANPPADDLLKIQGNISDVYIGGLNTNGSTDVSGTTYGTVRIQQLNSNTPDGVTIEGDTRSCSGHGYIIENASRLTIRGLADAGSISGDEVRFEAGSLTSTTNVYDVSGAEATRSITIDSSVERFITTSYVSDAEPPIIVESGKLRLGNDATSPRVYFGSDATPEGVVTADRGSLYIKRTGDSGDSMDKVWVKATGVGNTGWRKMQFVARASATSLADIGAGVNATAPEQGQMVYDSTNNRPVWKRSGSAGGVWVYSDGTTAHTPV